MYLLRKTRMVMFIADGKLCTSQVEITLKGKQDVLLHNLLAAINMGTAQTIFALEQEDIEFDIETKSLITDKMNIRSPYIVQKVPRSTRPGNYACILCGIEKWFAEEGIEVEILHAQDTELTQEFAYRASILWISANAINPCVLYTDKKSLDKKTILCGSIEHIADVQDPDVIVLAYGAGTTEANLDNSNLCDESFVITSLTCETGYAKD